MMRIAAALMIVLISGCTTLAPGAKEIIVTRNTADVQNCRVLGSVGSANGGVDELRNQALGMGADTILITSWVLSTETAGLGYRCSAIAEQAAK
jgi:hypothetical protein